MNTKTKPFTGLRTKQLSSYDLKGKEKTNVRFHFHALLQCHFPSAEAQLEDKPASFSVIIKNFEEITKYFSPTLIVEDSSLVVKSPTGYQISHKMIKRFRGTQEDPSADSTITDKVEAQNLFGFWAGEVVKML